VFEKVPYLDDEVILGGFWTPSVGVVDSLRAGTIMREKAQEMNALTSLPNTEVMDIEVTDGRVSAAVTDRGTIDTEYVVIACGCWSPRIAEMAGAAIPLTPAVHQMKDIGPVPFFADAKGDIEWPIIRDMDTFMYERQHGTGLEIGSYAHRAILYEAGEIPSNEQAALSPTEMPFVHEGVHVADDRPLDIALGVREERDRADVLHLVHRGCQRNRRARHLRDSWAPATTGDHDVLGIDSPAVGHGRGHAAVGHLDIHDLGVWQTR
jgi:glycine/D-amino acid oxidase-like deaminating enzyme